MRLKVLPLQFFYWDDFLEDDDGLVEIEPRYHRDNEYLLGDFWWFECDGRAFTYKDPRRQQSQRRQFLCSLDISDEDILTARELKAVETILNLTRNPRLKSEALKQWRRHDHAQSLREISRGNIKWYKE